MKEEVRMFTRLLLSILCSVTVACSSLDSSADPNGRGGGPRGGMSGRGGMPGGGSADGSFEEPVSVKAARVTRRPISRYLLSNTSLESIREVTIYAKVNALVEDLLVEEGYRVTKNQLLARLDDREIRNEHDQARIAVDQARLTLQQADVKARLSEANYKRSEGLVEQRLISPQEHDQAALANQTDALGLRVSVQQRDAAVSRLEAAQLQLDYTEIRSSIDGVVTQRTIDIGDRVNVNEALFNVEDFTPLWARIYLPERELSQIRLGQQAELRMQAFPDETFTGSIKMISPTVDSESGTIKVTLEISRHGDLLRPGMFGTVHIATETRPSALVIPKRAIVRERDEDRVFVVDSENRVRKRAVTIGFREDKELEISSGLSEGEAVVTVGQGGLNDGYPVSVLEWEGGREGPAPQATSPQRASSDGGAAPAAPGSRPSRQGLHSGGGRPRGGSPGGGARSFDPDRMKAMLAGMAERSPQIKKAYEAKLAEDPDFLNDPEKLGAFMTEIRSQFGRRRQ